MTNGGRTGGKVFSSTGSGLLILGLAALALGLYAGLPYFRGESCSMALLPLMMLFPIHAPAIVAGVVLLLVAWVRGRRDAAAGPLVLPIATRSVASRDTASGTRGTTQVLLRAGGIVLLAYGWVGTFWAVWVMAAARYGAMHRSEYAMLPGLLWNLLIAAAGLLMVLRARRR